jgi:hypothetical protein
VSAHSNSRRARLPCELRLFGPIRKKMPHLGALRALLSALWGATKEDLPVVTTPCRGLPLASALLLSCHSCHHPVWVAGWPEGWQTDYGAFKSPVAALRLSEAFQPQQHRPLAFQTAITPSDRMLTARTCTRGADRRRSQAHTRIAIDFRMHPAFPLIRLLDGLTSWPRSLRMGKLRSYG